MEEECGARRKSRAELFGQSPIFRERKCRLREYLASGIFLCEEILDELQAPEIVEMDDAEDAAILIYHDDTGDAALLHQSERLAREY